MPSVRVRRILEKLIAKKPGLAANLAARAYSSRELLKVGDRSFKESLRDPLSRFDTEELSRRRVLEALLVSVGALAVGVPLSQILGADVSDRGRSYITRYTGVLPPSYIVFLHGGRAYAKCCLPEKAGLIEFQGADHANVIQVAIDHLAPEGGRVFFKKGTYMVGHEITIPDHTGGSYVFTGEDTRQTRLEWSSENEGYIFNLDSDYWTIVYFEHMQLRGSITDTPVGHAIKIRRTSSTVPKVIVMLFCYVNRCKDPAIYADYVQDSAFIWCDVTTHNEGYSLRALNSSHINIYGGIFRTIYVKESLFRFYSGTCAHINIATDSNYGSVLHGIFFEPVPTGYESHVIVGSEGIASNTLIESCTFMTRPEKYFINVMNAYNCRIIGNNFLRTTDPDAPSTYIVIGSGAYRTVIDIPSYLINDLDRIVDNGIRTIVTCGGQFTGRPVAIDIENPNGTYGAVLLDRYSSNTINLAHAAKNITMHVRSPDPSAVFRVTSRNANNTADISRIEITNLTDWAEARILNATLVLPNDSRQFIIPAQSSPPSNPVAGQIYLDDGTNTADGKPHFRYYDGATWHDL